MRSSDVGSGISTSSEITVPEPDPSRVGSGIGLGAVTEDPGVESCVGSGMGLGIVTDSDPRLERRDECDVGLGMLGVVEGSRMLLVALATQRGKIHVYSLLIMSV